MSSETYEYDVALSFAGEDRIFAEELFEALRLRNIKVFYDKYEKSTLWGKNLYTYLSDIYQNKARYCVMLLSQHYAANLWTNHEREAAQARAFRENEEYILPVRLDSTEIPGVLPIISYLSWHQEKAEGIAEALLNKLRSQKTSEQWLLDPNIGAAKKLIALQGLGKSEEGIRSVVEEVQKTLPPDPKAHSHTRRQILVGGLVGAGLVVVGSVIRLAEVLISGSDQSKPPRSLSASLQYTYLDTNTDNSLKTGVLVTSVASSPDGKTLASASYDMTVKLWNPNTKDGSLRIFFGHTARVTSVAWSPNGKFLVSGSDDRTVRIWDVQTDKYVLPPFSIANDHVLSVAWSPDGTHIAAGGADADKAVWVWDVSTQKRLYRWSTSQVVWSVAWSNTGKAVAAANADEKLLIYNVVNGEFIYSDRREAPGQHPKLRIAWSHNGKFLAAGGDDTMIHTWLWDANQHPPLIRLPGVYKGHTATVNSLDWSPDDQYLVSGSDDTTFCIWDASNISSSSDKKPLYQSAPDQGYGSVNAVAWLRDDSRRIAVGRETGHIEIWWILER